MAQRKLAAIMFSDIIGYNSLLEGNEKKAFEIRKKNLRIHSKLLKKFNGKFLKKMGEAVLASFNSNIEATLCAIAIQKATNENHITLRIGIHQGDILFEKRDVLGDGVNIASRVQGVIDTEGIVISDRVYSDLKNIEGIKFETLGAKELKGVGSPMIVYRISDYDPKSIDYKVDTGELSQQFRISRLNLVAGILLVGIISFIIYYLWPGSGAPYSFEKSVVVLPFDNYTSDTLEYYTAGMHDNLIGDLGKISALKVISKTTSRAYKKSGKTIPEITAELGVNAVIDGAVTCLGDSVCLRIQMKDADSGGKAVWEEEFYVEKSQILSMYNTIARELSDKINIKLTPEDKKRLASSRIIDPEAYEAYLKGQQHWEKLNEESIQKAIEYFELAIEIDPDWAPPYVGLSQAWTFFGFFEIMPASATLPNEYKYLNKAIELDPNTSNTQYAIALKAVWSEWDWEKGERAFIKSLELNPSNALSRMYYAHLLMILNRFEEARYHADLAIETDPLSLVLGLYGRVEQTIGQPESILDLAKNALAIDPENQFAYVLLSDGYRFSGDSLKWYEIWKQRLWWSDEKVLASLDSIFLADGYKGVIRARIQTNEEVLRNGGRISYLGQAERYLIVEDYDRAMDYYEKAFDRHDGALAYISLDHYNYPRLKNNVRYLELLKKMNLPLPD